jgi:uncharacterized Zn-finger protein
MKFDLNRQELSVLISSMQYMTKQQEKATANPEIVSRLYNKLFSRHEYLNQIERHYTSDI